jgi:hypothetical protein
MIFRELRKKGQRTRGLLRLGSAQNRLKSTKFPVFSLVIREFDAENGSQQTASSAKPSSVFVFSADV